MYAASGSGATYVESWIPMTATIAAIMKPVIGPVKPMSKSASLFGGIAFCLIISIGSYQYISGISHRTQSGGYIDGIPSSPMGAFR